MIVLDNGDRVSEFSQAMQWSNFFFLSYCLVTQANLGQEEDFEEASRKATKLGAIEVS